MPFDTKIKKALVIGSGPIVIGQAAEFDYAGTQACDVLCKAGVKVVLVNSNPATIMTDRTFADAIYLEPLTLTTLKRIIDLERPDCLLAGFGGQTGLTLAMQLEEEGFLASRQVRIVGTNVEAIRKAEDRQLFKDAMERVHQPTIPSDTTESVEDALAIAERIGYPVIIRPAFTLGGGGGGTAYTPEELRQAAAVGIDASPISQILVEKYIYGWKEIEFETMRDSAGNSVIVCSMENVDPVGVHTGDSIVVAPALSLTEREFGLLREASLSIIQELDIIGGCNCQFALSPDGSQYAVIEVNPRVSRSSALASKATGYPIARVSARIALGYTLDEIGSDTTGKTLLGFEPAVEYIVVKFPKWPFDKFAGSSRRLGTQMKATGEVMSIAPTFEAALLKAVRGAEIGMETLHVPMEDTPLAQQLSIMDDKRLFRVFEAICRGMALEEIYAITKIDTYFLQKLARLAEYEKKITHSMDEASYREGKALGYTDKALAQLSGCVTEGLPPSYRIVDTCAAVFSAARPYFYAVTGQPCQARPYPRSGKPVVIVLGSGPIRIGQGIEFDYSSVHCVWALKKLGYEVVIINNNPETVSTDYDTADRLYFEPLTPEDVMGVVEVEHPVGVVVAFGGQTAIKLTEFLDRQGITILGTSAAGIDIAEDRERFDALLEQCGIRRPKGRAVRTQEEALSAAEALGYPLLLRPSYVIGGQNMRIVHTPEETVRYMERILAPGIDNPVLMDKYMPGTELEVDVISDGQDILLPGIMEHIERAGVHSGDSIAVYPPYSIDDTMLATITESSRQLALALGTKGLVNIQYLIHQGELYVIEVNPRASRTVPYISKVTGIPMVDIAARVMVGEKLAAIGCGRGLAEVPPYYTVKVPVFSFEKLGDANSYLGPEMKSTGEVLGIGRTLGEALCKGMTAAGKHFRYPAPDGSTGVYISLDTHDMWELAALAEKCSEMGFALYATEETAEEIRHLGLEATTVPYEEAFPLLESGCISFVVYTGALQDDTLSHYMALSRKALRLSIPVFTSLDTAHAAADMLRSGYTPFNTELVDSNRMRREKQRIPFAKMQAAGDDTIILDNADGSLRCPESLCIALCDRHSGIGGDGLVLLEPSSTADIRMRYFNRDGSEGKMAGNAVRCVGKYLYDKGRVSADTLSIETASGIKQLKLYTRNGKVSLVSVDMGKADFSAASLPADTAESRLVNAPLTVDGKTYSITCLSVGNPHCVVFCEKPDALPLSTLGPLFTEAPLFPERINAEFVRVVNPTRLRMRVYERGSGETPACGTGACAAVAAAVENGLCPMGEDILVEVPGGRLTVRCTPRAITLTGDARLVYEGIFYA